MKKLFTLIAAVAVAISAVATDYTHPMAVKVGEGIVPIEAATISLTENDGKYDLTLYNFVFGAGADAMPIGNVEATGLTGINLDGTVMIDASVTANITNGNDPNVMMWLGPIMFPQLPVAVKAQATPTNLEAVINITVPAVGDVLVYFGEATAGSVVGQPLSFDYSAPLAVEMAGMLTPQGNASLNLTMTSETTADFTLKNFIYTYPADPTNPTAAPNTLAFGNVEVHGLEVQIDTTNGTFKIVAENAVADITAGDLPGVPMWMGPIMFPQLPVSLKLEATGVAVEGMVALTVPMVGDLNVYFGEKSIEGAGIASATMNTEVSAIYDITGRRVNHMQPGTIYVVKMADGTCKKVVK